jgi:hypothetical protein
MLTYPDPQLWIATAASRIELPGLLRLDDRHPVTCIFDRTASRWEFDDTLRVDHTFLNAAYLQLVGAGRHLLITWPSEAGLAFLRDHSWIRDSLRAQGLIRQPPLEHRHLEFRVSAGAEALWRSFLDGLRQHYDTWRHEARQRANEELRQMVGAGNFEALPKAA